MEPSQLTPGTTLGGDFQIERPLSAGGMGAVYLAVQLSTGKQRALKVMHPSLVADPVMRERFVREARVGAMVPSDHVVEVVGAGVDPQLGLPWLAMELLSGENLSQHLARRGPLPIPEIVEILRPVCHALGAAHARGVVHRDIKPDNVFLARTQSTTHPMIVKVLDFGIARVAAEAKTASTAAMGTPMWMAPEQTELKSQVSPASDVWALGLMTFWLITGRHYWRAAGLGGSVPQLMREILFEPVDAASSRAAELGAAGVPPGFDEWFARCLARDPTQRFPNANDAANALFTGVLGVGPTPSIAPDPSGSRWPSVLPPTPASANATAVPTVVAVPARTRSPVALIAVMLLGVLGLGGAAAAFAAYFVLARGGDAPGPRASAAVVAPPAPDLPPTESSAVPAAEPSVKSTPAKKPPTGPAPPAGSAAPALGPYDANAATRLVQQLAKAASFGCKHMQGGNAYSGMVTFGPTGRTVRVTVEPVFPISHRGPCVRSHLQGAKISAYAGKATHDVPFAVSF